MFVHTNADTAVNDVVEINDSFIFGLRLQNFISRKGAKRPLRELL